MGTINYKCIIPFFIMGIMLWFVLAWVKITHQFYADTIASIPHMVSIVCSLLAFIKVLSNKKDDSFLNQ